jgi:hypothetical protein
MANNDFVKKTIKPAKNDGRYIFADFSTGLYLLDTPRGIGEQLASLALKGGRNVWTEYGALVPQYGYMSKAQLPEIERVVGITKDSKSSASVFILTMLGNVYYYSAYDGLRKYKTSFESIEEDALFTRMNNDLIIYTGGAAHMFGAYYKESQYEEIVGNATASNYGSYAVISVPYEHADYFWRGKKVAIKGIGGFNITSITESTIQVATSIPFSNLANTLDWTLKAPIVVKDSENVVINLDETSGLSVSSVVTKHEGTSSTVKTKTLVYECYKIKPVDSATSTVLQLLNLPTNGYFYLPPNSKVKAHCLFAGDQAPKATSASKVTYNRWVRILSMNGKKETYYPKVSSVNGKVAQYVYLESSGSHSKQNFWKLTRDRSGDLYKITTKTVSDPEYYTHVISFNIPLADGTVLTYSTEDLATGEYEWAINNDKDTGEITVTISTGETIVAQHIFTTGGLLKCVADNPDGEIPKGLCDYIDSTGIVRNTATEGSINLTVVPIDKETSLNNLTQSSVSIGEQSLLPIDLIYHPEDTKIESTTIVPKLLGSANNRLLIYDVNGNVYYSAVGILDDFKEADGAGYFGNFYNDTSECLEIEDYLNGALISKQNGLYYVTISDTVASGVTGNSGLSISKVSEIGQQYAGDHVIVGEKVYAFDSNSGSIVLACAQNVFGTVVAGKILVASEYIDSVNLGISEQRRKLVHNHEANCFILYYGEHLDKGLVLTSTGSLFPRELDIKIFNCVRFNQGTLSITREGLISQDFKKGTIILNKTPIADFEAIGLKDNRCICSSMLEVTELNGVEYNITTSNAGVSYQHINPSINYGIDKTELPPMVYSDQTKKLYSDSFELTSKWADKKSNLTRVYAPMSGRDGISISLEFAANQAFCLAALRLPDFSQGE